MLRRLLAILKQNVSHLYISGAGRHLALADFEGV